MSAKCRNNPAIGLITVLGDMPPAKVTINEFTTGASVWTNNPFLDGTAITWQAQGQVEYRPTPCQAALGSSH